jgi:cysteine desulfurase
MGIGAAYVRRKVRRRVEPLLHGGGQEGGLRSGTLPVALCVGLGEACRLAAEAMAGEALRTTGLRELFLAELRGGGIEFVVNGSMDSRLPGNLNLSFPGVDAEALLMSLRGKVSIASGSACSAQSLEASHVVQALGGSAFRAEEAVRIGFGRPTGEAEVIEAAGLVGRAVARLRSVSYGAPATGGARS